MEVMLAEKDSEALKKDIYDKMLKATTEVALKAVNAQPWLRGKNACKKWLGVSDPTLNHMIASGMPYHMISENVMMFNKDEVNEYILNK